MSITKPTPTTLRLLLSIKPNARSTSIVSVTEASIGLWIHAPPRDGEANAAVIEFVCDVLGVRKSDASVVRGGRGREKVLLLEGMREAVDVDDVRRILEGLVEKE